MKFYKLKDDYITYLKSLDPRVENNYAGGKPYIGVVLNIGIHNYFAPLTSHKPAHDHMSKNDTFFRLHERNNTQNKLGIIKLHNMVPALPGEVEELDFKEIQKVRPKYAPMLMLQYIYVTGQKQQIMDQAQRLYDRVVNKKQRFFVGKCLDFAKLEQEYLNYKKS